ncbi:MAG: DUF4349 domain-containing protein [Beutenbergiaceae bacterium]
MKATAILSIGLMTLALSGCATSQSDSSTVQEEAARAADQLAGSDSGAAQEMDVDGGAAVSSMDVDGQDREVITTAHASIEVEDPGDAADRIAALVTEHGGRVEGREEYAGRDEEPQWASLQLRVPAAEMAAVLDNLDELGTVTQINQNEQDVTGVVQDLDARISALETSTDRLTQIMADATDTADLLATESALSQRQADLEALQAQRDYLNDQVAMSTLSVSLQTEYVPQSRGGFLGGLQQGWETLIAFGAGLATMLGVVIPWLLALAIPVAILIWLVRRRRRIKRASATAS